MRFVCQTPIMNSIYILWSGLFRKCSDLDRIKSAKLVIRDFSCHTEDFMRIQISSRILNRCSRDTQGLILPKKETELCLTHTVGRCRLELVGDICRGTVRRRLTRSRRRGTDSYTCSHHIPPPRFHTEDLETGQLSKILMECNQKGPKEIIDRGCEWEGGGVPTNRVHT